MTAPDAIEAPVTNIEIRVRGRVQGVGFRPAVWRIANELGISGQVANHPDGVVIRASAPEHMLARFVECLRRDSPPLARIDAIETRDAIAADLRGFHIAASTRGPPRTQLTPDAVTCAACAREVLDRAARRYRYPFATCTDCGPRLSITAALPYDRDATTMASFAMCDDCSREYHDPADRRFHAEAIACPACGPQVRLVPLTTGHLAAPSAIDDIAGAAGLLLSGQVIAIKGLGGYQLACDATNAGVVERLRASKMRPAKPFALMARDLDVIRRYCAPTPAEERQLTSPEGPIVLMRATEPDRLPDAVAPGLNTLGFMLPTTPLHLLLMQDTDRPVVMTSGNLSDEPQIVDDDEALQRLAHVADFALVHDRKIAIRIDDSVVRVVSGVPRLIRRARGYAPAPFKLPPGFEVAPDILAMGGDLKSTFCLVRDGEAVLSQHQGDLDDATAFEELHKSLTFYVELFEHAPRAIAADLHPEYRSSKLARERARSDGLPLIQVQHHHAHVAACLAENGYALDGAPVLCIVLDGLGWGDDGGIWGGEFLLADYRGSERIATFKPVPMIGGDQASREPWRNLYAHLTAQTNWAEITRTYGKLELCRHLETKPRALLDSMVRTGLNSPPAASCGRLFDAVAAALGICRDRQLYEGEAAARLEALVDERTPHDEDDTRAYPFAILNLPGSNLPYLEPLPMWEALLSDLTLETPAPIIAARFHKGLGRAIATMAEALARTSDGPRFRTVALSGGCLQNAVLLSDVMQRLQSAGFAVLSHSQVPANDGGIALGQAAIAAARIVTGPKP
jgi:hydrogenase maturation protein HypF